MSARRFGTRRLVFVDRSAFEALAEPHHPRRDDVGAVFEQLLEEYERGDTILITLEAMAVPGLAEVCDVERLRPWLTRCAHETIADNPDLDLDLDLAAALVVMDRQGIGEVVAIDPRYDAIDVTVRPGAVTTWDRPRADLRTSLG